MDIFKSYGIQFDEVEFWIKISFQTAVVFVGVFGNLYTLYSVRANSTLPRTTNIFICALSVALIGQALTATIDYVNNLHREEEYQLGLAFCDTWNTLNTYLPMVLGFLCFFALMDRLMLLAYPERHRQHMSAAVVTLMVIASFLVPLVVTVPPMYYLWYIDNDYIKFRTEKECKFKANLGYALIAPIFHFWMPGLLNTLIITKMFKTLAKQDMLMALSSGSSCEKLEEKQESLPWKGAELQRQQRLALTMWSIYWNVTLFWIPQFIWQYIYKVTGADWPRATNFMAWGGYVPCLILPCLYKYFNVYNL